MQRQLDMPAQAIHAALLADHDDLDAELSELAHVFEDGDWLSARDAYVAFERRLARHFELEEQILFRDFARSFPRETNELLAEHRLIRKRVDELGIGIDVHQTRLTAIEELAMLIRAHAAREDRLLYRWTDAAPWTSAATDLFAHRRSPAPPEEP
jgi:hypothetical protein